MRRIFLLSLTLFAFALPSSVFADEAYDDCERAADRAGNSCLAGTLQPRSGLSCEQTHALEVAECTYDFCVRTANAYFDSCGQPGGTIPTGTCGNDYINDIASCDAELEAMQNALTPIATPTTPTPTAPPQGQPPGATANGPQGAIARTYIQIIGDGQGSGQGLIFANICTSRTTPCECRDNGNCAISDILQVAVNIVNFIIAISGSLVLAMFIYGGVLWVFSAGNEGMVKKGRDIIEGAVIGLIIILGAYAAVAIIVSILTKDKAVEDGTNLEDLTNGSQIFNTENP